VIGGRYPGDTFQDNLEGLRKRNENREILRGLGVRALRKNLSLAECAEPGIAEFHSVSSIEK
jgi:hypothetical protein